MKMSFEQYIHNPMGDKTSVITQREALKQVYASKFDKLMVREMGNIKHWLFKKEDVYIAYFKIPSEVIEKFYYDVVIEFSPASKIGKLRGSIANYNIRVFSNDPAFVFTFAHAFKKHDMLIKDLEPKMSSAALKEKPKEKNPKEVIGYVKSLYFAYLYMRLKGMFIKSAFENYCKPYSKSVLLSSIMNASEKVEARIEAGNALEKSKRAAKAKETEGPNTKRKMISKTRKVTKSAISKVPIVKNIAKVKSVRTIKPKQKM